MDGIHDLGGRHGFGRPLTQRDEATFHEPWERRVHALTALVLVSGCFNTDEFRHAVERVDPVAYLADGYYGRWLGAVERLVEEAAGRPAPGRIADTSAARELGSAPRFSVGDRVVTRNLHPAGHTRLPGYARGRRGIVATLHGGWVLPDTNAHQRGECPEHVYTVRFDGAELWDDAAEPGTRVCIDLFESYLEADPLEAGKGSDPEPA